MSGATRNVVSSNYYFGEGALGRHAIAMKNENPTRMWGTICVEVLQGSECTPGPKSPGKHRCSCDCMAHEAKLSFHSVEVL